jgi:putative transposase
MASYTQILYHIVFATKGRQPVLVKESREKLFRYVWGVLKNKECHLYRVNGVEDHLHILSSVHPSVALADLVREIKVSTSGWIKEGKVFPDFDYWAEGYGAFTIGWNERDAVIEYIKNQEEHHRKVSFRQEYIEMLKKFGVKYREEYLE